MLGRPCWLPGAKHKLLYSETNILGDKFCPTMHKLWWSPSLCHDCPMSRAGSTVMWKSWNSRASNSKWARPRFPQISAGRSPDFLRQIARFLPADRQISAGRSPDFVQQIDCRISGIVLRDWWTVSHYRIIIIIIHNYLKSSSWSQYAFSCHMAWYMRDPRRCLRIRS